MPRTSNTKGKHRGEAKEKEKFWDPSMPVVISEQPIIDTIRTNYMPYAMSVIVNRSIPEIDGFKPSQRKLLYTMYKMGLLSSSAPNAKSAKVVGQTMQLNPHGDAAIYETLVYLTSGRERLLHPFVKSKGTFGKHYSKSPWAASRYTEVKLDKFSTELFGGIDKNAVDMVPNFDNTMLEPSLLPTSFPNILVMYNKGMAVSLGTTICSFNLGEICDTTVMLLRNPKVSMDKILDVLKAPDFPIGGNIIYKREQLREIYETGKGSFRIRAEYTYDKKENKIDVTEIPYTTTIDEILDKIKDLMVQGKLKEITDARDAIGLSGCHLKIDLRRGTDPDALMQKLFRLTPLEDSFPCNFVVLINSSPKQLGVRDILLEWISFRIGCVRRELTFDLGKKKEKMHLLLGLGKILVDIDKAIRIVRETEKEADVVPRLMEGFGIDEQQAEYIAEIKLRYLNREYIINRIREMETLKKEIADLEAIIADDIKIKGVIAAQLQAIKTKYAKPRATRMITVDESETYAKEDTVENYPVSLFMTRTGYFKKITKQSLMRADDQNLKEGDEIVNSEESENIAEVLFFTNKAQVYKAKVDDFNQVKASEIGEFVASKLSFSEKDERPIMMKALKEYDPRDNVIFIFENGKGVRVPVTAYETKSNRKKLTNAFSDVSPIVAAIYEHGPTDLLLINDAGRAILIKSTLVPLKTTRTSQGSTLFSMKKGVKIAKVIAGDRIQSDKTAGCRKIKVPASGVSINYSEQLSIN